MSKNTNASTKKHGIIRVSALPPQLQESFLKIALDHDALGDTDDFSVMSDLDKEQQTNRLLQKFITASVVACLILIAGIFGASITLARLLDVKLSLEPLLHGHLPSEIFKSIVDFSFFKFVGCMMLAMAIMYPLMHKILLFTSKRYAALEVPSKQIIVTHHALEAIVLSIIFPFFTYYFVGVFFCETNNLEEILDYFRGFLRCAILLVLQYSFELASRFQHPRPILIFHHVLAIMDMLLMMFFPTSIVVKSAAILVYSICYEALIFAGLFLYRIAPERRIASDILMAGMVIFGITRPIQVLLVVAALFGSWGDDGVVVKWQAIFQVVVTIILTIVQVYTLKIQYSVWKRCVAKRMAIIDDEADTAIIDGEDATAACAYPVVGIDDEEEKDIESQGVEDKDVESICTKSTQDNLSTIGSH